MTPIPSPLSTVTVPLHFFPSALGAFAECALKFIVSSLRRSESPDRLIAGPEAAVGTLLHRVVERTTKERSPADEIFRQEYDRAADEMRRDYRRAHFADLASTKSLAEWARLKSWIMGRATIAGERRTISSSANSIKRSAVESEQPLTSETLRLTGSADHVRQLGPNRYEIRDFKSGTTLDEDGRIKPAIVLQLHAYGLLLLERSPGAEIRLLVDDGEEREIPFGGHEQRLARQTISSITASMPKAGPQLARDLAKPGSGCVTCSIRHVCSAYRADAPNWWKNYPQHVDRLPNDIWGTPLEVLGDADVDVILLDDAGRKIRIEGLSARHGITSSTLKRRIWLFGLEATGPTRGFDGRRFHPRIFHELPRDRTQRRGWIVQVFEDQDAGSAA